MNWRVRMLSGLERTMSGSGRGIAVVWGGGTIGSMERLVDAVLSERGTVVGVLADFMA